MTKNILVQNLEKPIRLDKYLSQFKEVGTRSQAERLIKSGNVLINGNIAKSSNLVNDNDNIVLHLKIESESSLIPYNIPLDIVFEDEDLIVVNKPAGLVVHPSAGHANDTLVNALIHHAKDLSMGFEETRPGIVHRIDRDTSGLIVIAKNNHTHSHLAEQFKEKSIFRVYYAICFGYPKEDQFSIESLIARHPNDRKRFAVSETEGKIAKTHFRVIAKEKGLSLIECRLETGRTHQIRVHLSSISRPVVADWTYVKKSAVKSLNSPNLRALISRMDRFALHAAKLGFQHPKGGQSIQFQSDWPKDLVELIKACGFPMLNDVSGE